MNQHKTAEEILRIYEKKTDEIIGKMLNELMRAQRKADDSAYRKELARIRK